MSKFLLEYYEGDPDTIDEYDDETRQLINRWQYDRSPGISFGWFQTSLDGEKEFIAKENTCHKAIADEAANKVMGKAVNSPRLTDDAKNSLAYGVYYQSCYKGRTFTEAKVLTTWSVYPSWKIEEIVTLLGGIEKFADYQYVVVNQSVNLYDYIMSGYNDGGEMEERRLVEDLKGSMYCPSEVEEIIRSYNSPNSKLALKTAKLGNMTIAQYNSLIRQEGRKTKKTLNEKDMKIDNKHQKEFSNYLTIMNEALKRNDFKAYDVVRDMLDESVSECKHEKALMSEMRTTNFGVLNHIFESELPTLIKKNKKAVRNVIKTIKEDKNLLGEFNFYNTVKNKYTESVSETLTPEELITNVMESLDIDQATLKDSNKKLMKVMEENGVVPSDFVGDEDKKLYENCHAILSLKKSPNNVIRLAESIKNVGRYMESHKGEKTSEKSIDSIVEDFGRKMKDTLNESEMSFVQQITDFKSPIAEQRKRKLFDKFKNECISKIDTMLKEDSSNDALKGLRSDIDKMEFKNETIVRDMAKLLEIRDILMDD